jgi:hypothetical protein
VNLNIGYLQILDTICAGIKMMNKYSTIKRYGFVRHHSRRNTTDVT